MDDEPRADERPDWAEGREQCPTCRHWKPVRKDGRVVKHKRQGRGWRMEQCEGSGTPPLGGLR
jgi:hypothetical protein